jgi:hypothetical protein
VAAAIKEIQPAAEIVKQIMNEYTQLKRDLTTNLF